ncbi:hypothetical protein ABH995_000885 [Bradyrhizobium yuanmingense]|uniref:hypothetical protein n=1 Tax=Bradyrhizobium yuanmingense TaxID=108015 RepID=UPI00351742DA
MTDDMMNLRALVEKTPDADLLRETVNGARNLLRSGTAKFPSWRDGDQPST